MSAFSSMSSAISGKAGDLEFAGSSKGPLANRSTTRSQDLSLSASQVTSGTASDRNCQTLGAAPAEPGVHLRELPQPSRDRLGHYAPTSTCVGTHRLMPLKFRKELRPPRASAAEASILSPSFSVVHLKRQFGIVLKVPHAQLWLRQLVGRATTAPMPGLARRAGSSGSQKHSRPWGLTRLWSFRARPPDALGEGRTRP